MPKSFRLIAASLLTVIAAQAHADYVSVSQGVGFTFHAVDADSFTLRIQNADAANGNWAGVSYLSYLSLGGLLTNQSTLSSAAINVSTASSGVSWMLYRGTLNSNGCAGTGTTQTFCLDANPNIKLSGDMLFTVDLLGSNIDLLAAGAPTLKVGFTSQAGSGAIGTLSAGSMSFVAAPVVTTPTDQTANPTALPEPASLALAGLALVAAASARRRRNA